MFWSLEAVSIDYTFINYKSLITIADKVQTIFASRSLNLAHNILMLLAKLLLSEAGNIISAKEANQIAYSGYDSNHHRCGPTEIHEAGKLVTLYSGEESWDRFTVPYKNITIVLPIGFGTNTPSLGRRRY